MTVERKWWSVAPAAVLVVALAGCGGAQAGGEESHLDNSR